VFSSLIAFNEMLTSHCYNLSTHHYHPTNHPRFDTQFRHSETTQQHFCAVARSFRKKRKRSTLPFCTKEIGKKITSKLFRQGLGLQEKGILANVMKDPQQLNGPESNFYRFLSSLLPSFLPSCSHPRKHDLLPSLTYAFGVASYSSSYLSRLPSNLSPFSFVYLLLTLF